MNKATLYRAAWKVLPRLPKPLVYAAAHAAADVTALGNGRSVRQLRENYVSLLGHEVPEKMVRDGVRSYFRSMAQQLTLTGWSAEEIRTSGIYPGVKEITKLMDEGPVVLALTHSGNWDLAGAWFCESHGSILTVAEKLEPPELFEEFVRFRNSIGLEIIGVGPGEHIFDELVEKVRGRSLLVPLLADRDISGSGIEVKLGEESALVAAGPAALAVALDRPLIAGHIHYRKVDRKWKIVFDFTEPIPCPEPSGTETLVEAWTRAWVKEIVPVMQRYFVDWHMMQKVFVKDLDLERLERARERHRTETQTKEIGGES